VKIFAFKVDVIGGSLADLLAEIDALPIGDRLRYTASGEISLKSITKVGNGIWELDFTKFRHTGPGRAPRDAPNEDFNLNADEFFGEETAAYFVAGRSTIAVQFNHYGPRNAAIEQYFQSMAFDFRTKMLAPISSLALVPVVRNDAFTRLSKLAAIRRMEFKVYVPGALASTHTVRPSVGQVLKGPILGNSQEMTVKLSSGRSRSFDLQEVKSTVTDLLGLGSDLTYLKVHGAEDENEPSQPLDLLGAQLTAERGVASASRKRIPLPDRMIAIKSAYDEWAGSGQI
jgi:hypothetical protein